MKKRLLAVAIVALFSQVISADEALTPEKRKDIARMMELIGGTAIVSAYAHHVSQQLSQSMTTNNKNVPQQAYVIVNEEVNKVLQANMKTPGGILDLISPVYHKIFTHSEVKEINQFYSSKIGEKVRQFGINVKVAQDSAVLVEGWGKVLLPTIKKKIEDRLKKESIKINKLN